MTTVPDDQSDPDCADEINQRKEDRVIKDCLDIRLAMLVINLGEAAQEFCFRIKYLDRLRAGEMLLKERIDARDSRAHHVKATTRAFAKQGSSSEKHRDRNQSNQRELPIHVSHNTDDSHNHH